MIFPSRRKTGTPPLEATEAASGSAVVEAPVPAPAPVVSIKDRRRDDYTELKVMLHQQLIDRINLAALDPMTREQMQRE